MDRPFFLIITATAGALCLSGCAVSGGRNPDGSEWFFGSLMENTASESRAVDHQGMYESKAGKDQTTGAKTISNAILAREAIREGAAALRDHIDKNRAIEEATIGAGSDLSILKETNRSAEVMQGAALAAEAAGP